MYRLTKTRDVYPLLMDIARMRSSPSSSGSSENLGEDLYRTPENEDKPTCQNSKTGQHQDWCADVKWVD